MRREDIVCKENDKDETFFINHSGQSLMINEM